MANYEAPLLLTAVSTAYKTTGVLQAAGRRAQVYEVEFGQSNTPVSTDQQCLWDLSRFSNTNSVTATTVAANLLDQADITATTLFFNNVSGTADVPNYTTVGLGLNLKYWAINQRGSYRWRALDDGDNLIVASGASQGIGVRTLSAGYNTSAVGNISFIER